MSAVEEIDAMWKEGGWQTYHRAMEHAERLDALVAENERLMAMVDRGQRVDLSAELSDCITENERLRAELATARNDALAERVAVSIREIIWALEREAGNTDTSAQWMAATALRAISEWQQRTLIVSIGPQRIETVSLKREGGGNG